MALGFLKKLLDTNEKELNRLRKVVEQVNSFGSEMEKLEEEDFAARTADFKLRLERGETLDDILPEAFALVKEAVKRVERITMYDVQLIAAMVLHEGKVAEQKTGEGKTVSAVPALYLNALTGRGAHLVTVNDYLARRDAGWNAPIFALLGLSTSVVVHNQAQQGLIYDSEFIDPDQDDERLRHLRPVPRREAYEADITYGTNTEFGFDYLRDNMAQSKAQQNQRGHHFAIVDEVDSILVDEARTPLIISMPDTEPTDKYYEFNQMVNRLSGETDYTVDEKLKSASLTDHGIKKVEKILGVDNLYEKDFDTIHHIENALRAKTLYLRDRDYIVKDGQIVIVDEFTGRLMPGRRWSEGMHQAVEVKEGVKVQQESRTLATISLQNYFRMYDKMGGMTGTAATEAEELRKIYELEVVVVPTNVPVARKDHADVVYKSARAKYAAIARLVEERHRESQPVLVGTTSIDKNEIIAELLKRKGIPHQVLNAKNHEKEASIIAQAGAPGAVTVATNIAGRGVDIVLGGAKPERIDFPEGKKGDDQFEKALIEWKRKHDEVLAAGGLYVVGTERHESRRIDNQLRGRSGRQGDPGASRFFVALDDDIMRLFGGEQVANLMTALKLPEDQPIESGIVSKSIEQAQVKVEGFHFDQRKHLVEYDDVMNKQREIIYELRQKALEDHSFKEEIMEKSKQEIEQMVALYAPKGFVDKELDQLVRTAAELAPMSDEEMHKLRKSISDKPEAGDVEPVLEEKVMKVYEAKETELGEEMMRQVERATLRGVIDNLWMDHLDAIDDLRQGIGLRGYGQRDPLTEYKQEAFAMFESLMAQIDYQLIRRVLRARVAVQMPQSGIRLDRVQTVHEDKSLKEEAQEAEVVSGGSPQVIPPLTKGGLGGVKRSSKSSGDLSAFATAMSGVTSPTLQTTSSTTHKGTQQTVVSRKIGRNDPCWCGSGRKFKKCHYPQMAV